MNSLPLTKILLISYLTHPSVLPLHPFPTMPSTLLPPLPLLLSHPSKRTLPLRITCGPRDNRGPILRGRTLSTESILAVQSLKRSLRNPSLLPHLLSSSLPRLLLPDLLSSASELLRQDLPLLALSLLPILRSDPSYSPNLSLYADILASLRKNNAAESQIDEFVQQIVYEMETEGGIKGKDLRGPARLVKKMVAAGRGKDVRRVYGLMKKGGCVPNEYLFGFLARGLRRLGDEEGAREVERDFERWDVEGEWGEETEEEEGAGTV